MTAPRTRPPTPSATAEPAVLSAGAIADVGAGLTRLLVALIPLSARAIDAVSNALPQIISSVTKPGDNTASSQGTSDLNTSTSNLINSSADLSLGLLKAVLGGLDTTARAVNKAVQDASEPPRT